MYVRIEWTHIKVKDTMEQEEISTKLDKISYKIEIINTELYKT